VGHYHGARSPPGALVGFGEARSGVHGEGGGSARRHTGGARGPASTSVSGFLDSLGSPPGVAVEMLQRSGRDVVYRWRAIAQAARLTGDGLWSKIRRVQAGGRGQQARARSCVRGGGPEVVGRGREAVAWPVRSGAEESVRRSNSVAAARVVGVAAKKDRVQGVRWVSLKGQGGVWASVPRRAQA
jgi:hypothetical protein